MVVEAIIVIGLLDNVQAGVVKSWKLEQSRISDSKIIFKLKGM